MFKYFRLLFLFSFISLFSATAYADPNPPATPPGTPPGGGETPEQKLAAALRREEELKAEIAALKKGGTPPAPPPAPPKPEDDDLVRKVQKDKQTADDVAKQTKEIERALGFNMKVHQFVQENKGLLPAEIAAIVQQADKETYDNAQAKASAVKSAIIQSYFAVQGNMDALTPAQKVVLEDYLKLTKTAKEQRAAEIYENIFEPALETIRKVKKAEEVSRSRLGYGTSTDTNSAYKDRLIATARKTHLGEKENQRA